MKPNYILVTGFGPFGEHRINASWEAVSALPDTIEGYTVVKKQIPVTFKHVEDSVPLLWQLYDPKLVVHVGVSSYTTEIKLESCANKTGYRKADVENSCFGNRSTHWDKFDTDECLTTDLCTQTICEKLNQLPQLKFAVSNNAGRYLCEFTYYVSLKQNSQRTLFVHVPPLDKPFSKSQLAEGLEEIIKCALELLRERKYTCLPADVPRIYRNGRAAAAF